MPTWILIVMTGAYYGNNLSTVPGYKTKEECQAAADYYDRQGQQHAQAPGRTKAFCIPGPKL